MSADWTPVYINLESEIKLRHYSPKTLEAYRGWARQFQAFTRSKDPQLLSASDVKDFLTFPLRASRREGAFRRGDGKIPLAGRKEFQSLNFARNWRVPLIFQETLITI